MFLSFFFSSKPDTVRIGETYLRNANNTNMPSDYKIESITAHPNYVRNGFYNDIALLKLVGTVQFSDKVRPACLWQTINVNYTNVIATGYGHTEFGKRNTQIFSYFDNNLYKYFISGSGIR